MKIVVFVTLILVSQYEREFVPIFRDDIFYDYFYVKIKLINGNQELKIFNFEGKKFTYDEGKDLFYLDRHSIYIIHKSEKYYLFQYKNYGFYLKKSEKDDYDIVKLWGSYQYLKELDENLRNPFVYKKLFYETKNLSINGILNLPIHI